MKRRAFTLFEVVAALALFAIVAVVIGQASYNVLYAVSMMKKDSERDAYTELMRASILKISSLEELRRGVFIDDPYGVQVQVKGEAEATDILDLFILRVEAEEVGYKETFYLQRPKWYDQLPAVVVRDNLKQDRTDFLDDTRRAADRNREVSK